MVSGGYRVDDPAESCRSRDKGRGGSSPPPAKMLRPLAAIVIVGVDTAAQQGIIFKLDAPVSHGRDTAGPAWGLGAPAMVLVPCRRVSRRHGSTMGRLRARGFSARQRGRRGELGCSGQMVKNQGPLLCLSTMPWGSSTRQGWPAATRSWPGRAWEGGGRVETGEV